MSEKQVHHLVLFAFKDDITPAEVQTIFEKIGELKEIIPGIVSYIYGKNNSIEGLAKGYEYAFTTIFESIEARNAYVPHPEHVRVVNQYILPALKDGDNSALVIDYENNTL